MSGVSLEAICVWESAVGSMLDDLRTQRLDRATNDHLLAQEVLAAQGVALETGERLRLLPHVHDTDGFFAAVMERAKGG